MGEQITFRVGRGVNLVFSEKSERKFMSHRYVYQLGTRTWSFQGLRDVMAKASPARSGDRLAGVAASSEQTKRKTPNEKKQQKKVGKGKEKGERKEETKKEKGIKQKKKAKEIKKHKKKKEKTTKI